MLPQILRRDLTVNCPSIRSTTNDQVAAWPGRKLNDVAATEEMSRSANLGAAITYHPPACKRQVKQSSAVAKMGLSTKFVQLSGFQTYILAL